MCRIQIPSYETTNDTKKMQHTHAHKHHSVHLKLLLLLPMFSTKASPMPSPIPSMRPPRTPNSAFTVTLAAAAIALRLSGGTMPCSYSPFTMSLAHRAWRQYPHGRHRYTVCPADPPDRLAVARLHTWHTRLDSAPSCATSSSGCSCAAGSSIRRAIAAQHGCMSNPHDAHRNEKPFTDLPQTSHLHRRNPPGTQRKARSRFLHPHFKSR
jgi:hypothetical protein